MLRCIALNLWTVSDLNLSTFQKRVAEPSLLLCVHPRLANTAVQSVLAVHNNADHNRPAGMVTVVNHAAKRANLLARRGPY